MAIEMLSKRAGVFNPDELSLLRQAYEAACRELRISAESKQAESVALTALSAFKKGAGDKETLLTAILDIYQDGAHFQKTG